MDLEGYWLKEINVLNYQQFKGTSKDIKLWAGVHYTVFFPLKPHWFVLVEKI